MISSQGVITTIAGGLATPVPSIVQAQKGGAPAASVAAGYAGDTLPATEGQLRSPSGVAVDNVGGTNLCATAPCIYIADSGNNTVRCVGCLNAGVITTVAGTAPGVSTVCPGGSTSLNPTCAAITENAGGGDGFPATIASISNPLGVAVDNSGNLLIADTGNHMLRIVNATTQIITTLVGSEFAESGRQADGLVGDETFLDDPVSVAVAPDGGVIYAEGCTGTFPAIPAQNVFGTCENSRIRRWDPKTNLITTISAGGTPTNAWVSLATGTYADGVASTTAIALVPTSVATDSAGNVYFTDATNRVRKMTKK
jgi:hypothetical protein